MSLFFFALDRGWVGWKRSLETSSSSQIEAENTSEILTSDDSEKVELIFEFDKIREFHQLHIFTNNQFTREVAVFRKVCVFFALTEDR